MHRLFKLVPSSTIRRMAVSTGLLLALATTAEVQASSGVTATVTAVTGGSLVEVSGTNGVDTVTFEEDGANYIVTSNGVTIATTSDPVRVIFEGKDGGDYFSNETDIPSTVYGGEGNDFLYGGNVDDIIYGNKGADYIECGAGDDVVYGGNGSDEIYGGDDNDELWGEEDADAIYGGAGSDTLRGGKGDDTLVGQDDVDYIYGGNGNDDMLGCGGNDHVYGQSGSSDESDCGNDNNDTACVAEDDTAFQSNDSLCS